MHDVALYRIDTVWFEWPRAPSTGFHVWQTPRRGNLPPSLPSGFKSIQTCGDLFPVEYVFGSRDEDELVANLVWRVKLVRNYQLA
jgi:hypothetical protein